MDVLYRKETRLKNSSYYDNPVYINTKRFLFEFLRRTGLCAVFRYLHRNSVLVLAYHDILPQGFPENNVLFGMTVNTEEFEWQLNHIKANYNPISLGQLSAWLAGESFLPPRPVLLTFDDGHNNNLHHALPALRKRQMPAACFVVAGNLGSRHLTWVEDGYDRLMSSAGKEWVTLTGERHVLGTRTEQFAACSRFFRLFQTLSEEEQDQEMENLRSQLPLEDDGARFPTRFEFLAATELRILCENNVEIGAHTMTHPILSTLKSQTAQSEIVGSKLRLEEAAGKSVTAFAYPFGMPGADFTERDKDFVREAGFSLAFSGVTGFISRDKDRFSLPRIGVGRMSRAHFVATITGTLDALKHVAGKVT